ncbi:MAG TPA: acyl-CoA dehydrogenase family protein [Enhygromyxa sp.]|nr:acyl-CoA dehydrogenase family protein [Enhygromyxa sp.]
MTQADDFGFGEEARMLEQTARQLLHKQCSPGQVHRLVAGDPSYSSAAAWDRELWRQMIELGWTAIAVPSDADGFGMNLVAIAGLAEELGRAACPSPLPTTLCSTYVLAACASEPANALLRRIVEGAAVSLAWTDRRGSWELADTDVSASIGERTILNGTAYFVQDASKADVFVVEASSPQGVGLYIVEADAPGVTIAPDVIVDLTRDQARVVLRDVEVTPDRIAAAPGEALRALQSAEPALLVITAADMVGAAEWQLQTTTEYAKTRVQFDRPLGFFQAVKHPLVDMMIMIDEARSLLYDAACSFDHEPEQALLRARMAKAAASDAAAHCSGRSVQLHGGIGFTWECFVQLYFKRQRHSVALLGDGAHHRAKLADLLIGPIGTFQ